MKNILLITLFALILCGCISPPIQLQFEWLYSQGSGGLNYHEEEPSMDVLASAEEADSFIQDVGAPPEIGDLLNSVNYDENIVVIIYRGEVPGSSPTYNPEILETVRKGNQVIVHALFSEPGDDELVGFLENSPYTIISISKTGEWGQVINFVLNVDGEVIAKVKHYVP